MLKFLHEIENINDNQLRKKVMYKIEKLERKSKKNCPEENEIGYKVGYQPTADDFDLGKINFDGSFTLNCVYGPFARLDTKMVYGLTWNTESGLGINNGNYYYMDDHDYLYDFCKYIQGKSIEDEYELFEYIRDFLLDYFGLIKKVKRERMHQLILRNDDFCFDPAVEHSIKDFKGKGNAMCSEYAIMAHNILKLFDFESYLVVGTVILDEINPLAHAYNLVSFKEEDSNRMQYVLLDFINSIDVFDINGKRIDDVPFMGFFDEFDERFMNEFIDGKQHLVFDEYQYVLLGDSVFKIDLDNRKRDYYIDDYLYANPDVNYCKNNVKVKKTML